jgi:hypothetical protein
MAEIAVTVSAKRSGEIGVARRCSIDRGVAASTTATQSSTSTKCNGLRPAESVAITAASQPTHASG